MSSKKDTTYYMELQPGDAVQDGDQWLDSFGQWQPYVCKDQISGVVFFGVKARRPIRTTHQTTYEEVPGTRTLQQAVEQPQRKRWAYEELQAGDLVQDGDQWLNPDGRWQALVLTPEASMDVGEGLRARRPHNITRMLTEFANQAEVLAEVRADEKRLFDDLELLRSEYIKLQAERDKARAEVTQLRAERQEWIDRCNAESVRALRLSEQLSAAEVAVKSAQRARDELQLQVDELRAGLMGVVSAKHVHSMLEDMLDQTELVGQCLDSSTFEQMSCIQRTISVIAERVSDMGKEGTSADA